MAWEIPIDNGNANPSPREFIRHAQKVSQRRPHIPSYRFLEAFLDEFLMGLRLSHMTIEPI